MKKIFSVICSLAILANSLLYPFSIAYAQEVTPTAEPAPVAEETQIPSPEPSAEPTTTSTAEPTTNEEVLGENTESGKTQTPEVKGTETDNWNARNIALISFGSALLILALLLLWRKNKK